MLKASLVCLILSVASFSVFAQTLPMCGSFQNFGCACKNESLQCTAGVNAMIGYTGGQSIVVNAKNVLATQSGQTATCLNGHWEVRAGKGGVAFGCQG